MTKHVTFIIAVVLLFASCRTPRTVSVEHFVHDTLWHERTLHDSIFKLDSVFVSQFVRGDTVYQTREKWCVMYKDKFRHDTIARIVTDTVNVEKVREVERRLTTLQRVRMHTGDAAAGLVVLLVVGYAIKRKLT